MTITIRNEDIQDPQLKRIIGMITRVRAIRWKRAKIGVLGGMASGAFYAGLLEPRAVILTAPIGAITGGMIGESTVKNNLTKETNDITRKAHQSLHSTIHLVAFRAQQQINHTSTEQTDNSLAAELLPKEYLFEKIMKTHPIAHVNYAGDLIFRRPTKREVHLLKKQQKGKFTLGYTRIDLREPPEF